MSDAEAIQTANEERWGKSLHDVIEEVADAACEGEEAYKSAIAKYPGYDVNMEEYDAVLHLVVGKKKNLAAAKMLIENKADPNVGRGYSEQGPLWDASLNGDLPMVKMLLAAGANPGKLDCDRCWPLTGALSRGHVDVALAILAAGGNNLPLSAREICWDKSAVDVIATRIRHTPALSKVVAALLEREKLDAEFAASDASVTATVANFDGADEDVAALVLAAKELGVDVAADKLEAAQKVVAAAAPDDEESEDDDEDEDAKIRAAAERVVAENNQRQNAGPAQ